jgi:selenophosphate synthetase-related protein
VENVKVVADVLDEVGLTVVLVGEVDGGDHVVLQHEGESAVLFDLSTDVITGALPKDIKS